MSSIKYIVKPEEGLVIGIGTYTYGELLPQFKYERMNFKLWCVFNSCVDVDFYDVKQFKATAKCSGGDVFDEGFGKELVRKKIYKKKALFITKSVSHMMDALSTVHEQLFDVMKKSTEDYFSLCTELDNYY